MTPPLPHRLPRLRRHRSYRKFTCGVPCALVVCLWLCSGCYVLDVLHYTLDFCEFPGNCGAEGNVLFSLLDAVWEVTPSGEGGEFVTTVGLAGGLGFDAPGLDLLLYVATPGGLRVYRGNGLEYTIIVPDCEWMVDLVVLPDSSVVVSCQGSRRLVKIDPVTRDVEESFDCCDGTTGFEPTAIALASDGSLLAGTTRIDRFDGETGAFLGVVVEAEVGCGSDDQCGDMQTCERGRCLPDLNQCLSDSACPNGKACEGDRCASVACEDTCEHANDGECDDGGLGAEFALCRMGTDCSDCGTRMVGPSYVDLVFGPDRDLFVSRPDIGVLRFDGTTFEFLGVFVPLGRGGLVNPRALVFNEEGNLLVAGNDGPFLFVLEFDGQTGEFIADVFRTPEQIGELSIPSMVFRP